MTSLTLITWVTVNALAAWYYRYLGLRGQYYLTNAVQLMENVQSKVRPGLTKKENDRLRSTFNTARKLGRQGHVYFWLSVAGSVLLVTLNLWIAYTLW